MLFNGTVAGQGVESSDVVGAHIRPSVIFEPEVMPCGEYSFREVRGRGLGPISLNVTSEMVERGGGAPEHHLIDSPTESGLPILISGAALSPEFKEIEDGGTLLLCYEAPSLISLLDPRLDEPAEQPADRSASQDNDQSRELDHLSAALLGFLVGFIVVFGYLWLRDTLRLGAMRLAARKRVKRRFA